MKAIAYAIVTSTCFVAACFAPGKGDQFVMLAIGSFCFGCLLSTKEQR